MSFENPKVNTVQAKNQFNALVSQAQNTKQPIIVEKRGQPIAVILDYETYKKEFTKTNNVTLDLVSQLQTFHQHLSQKYPNGTGDAIEILRELRDEKDL